MSVFQRQKTLDRLEDRLRSQELKCDDLERANRKLDMEFTELYDKVSHQMSRMAKRYARAEKETINDAEPEIPAGDETTIDPISARILRRRNAGGFPR